METGHVISINQYGGSWIIILEEQQKSNNHNNEL